MRVFSLEQTGRAMNATTPGPQEDLTTVQIIGNKTTIQNNNRNGNLMAQCWLRGSTKEKERAKESKILPQTTITAQIKPSREYRAVYKLHCRVEIPTMLQVNLGWQLKGLESDQIPNSIKRAIEKLEIENPDKITYDWWRGSCNKPQVFLRET